VWQAAKEFVYVCAKLHLLALDELLWRHIQQLHAWQRLQQ
jgi:hypothetical protein